RGRYEHLSQCGGAGGPVLTLRGGLHSALAQDPRPGSGERQRGGGGTSQPDGGLRCPSPLVLCLALWSPAVWPEADARGSGAGGELMRLTRAVTHIRLGEANPAKLEALDALAADYLRLCQQYTTYFCTEAPPEKYAASRFASPLSQRWESGLAIQQAAGSAQSWRSNYAAAYQAYLDRCQEHQDEPEGDPPEWKEWNTPVVKEPVIQANANVALLQPSQDSSFDYWLRLSTLEKGEPVLLPVQLASYHHQALAGKTLNTSM